MKDSPRGATCVAAMLAFRPVLRGGGALQRHLKPPRLPEHEVHRPATAKLGTAALLRAPRAPYKSAILKRFAVGNAKRGLQERPREPRECPRTESVVRRAWRRRLQHREVPCRARTPLGVDVKDIQTPLSIICIEHHQ